MAELCQEGRETGGKKIGNYVMQKTIGKGTFGKVKLATHLLTGQKVAIKILEKDKIVDVADVQRVTREIHILKLIRHPNIIQLYQIIETPKHLFLVMEYMQRGELFDYIDCCKRMEEDEACKIFQQIISGIEYIHKLRIVHRDLKLQNCLIDYDKTIRIVDFGLSNTYKPDELLRTACGSPCYAAPQMIEGRAPYEPLMVDIWSAGVILFAMVSGFLPFDLVGRDMAGLYRKILNCEYIPPSHLSPDLVDFIAQLLTVDPNNRIRPAEMKRHPWWRKHSDNHYPEGIIVGYHKIPIEAAIVQEMKIMGFDVQHTEKSLESNLHNSLTTTYHILLKKYLRNGDLPKNHSQEIDKLAVFPNERRSKNNLKAADLLKMISMPAQKQRSRSLYQGARRGQEDPKTLGSQSFRMDQKRRSASKHRNKSLFKNNSQNNSKFLKLKKGKKDKSINKSHKSPKGLQKLEDDAYVHPRGQRNKMGKKSHHCSYKIGIDSGVDWQLDIKQKGNAPNRIHYGPKKK